MSFIVFYRSLAVPKTSTETQVIRIYKKEVHLMNFRLLWELVHDHGILLNKLAILGLSIPLLNFFKSYLVNRSQSVQYQGFKSVRFVSLSGVPQGSILGPMLLNIFINGIILDLRCPVLMYADDLKIFNDITDISDCTFYRMILF